MTGNGANCNVPVSWTAPTATDDCGLASLTANYNIGHTFSEGATTVTYTAIDNCGNTVTASFTVTIACVCNTAPQLTCPANFAGCVGLSSDPATTGTAVALAGSPTCGVPALNYTDVTISSGPCAGALVLERTWTATVTNNNTLTTACVQTITLGDNGGPTFSNVPTDITVNAAGSNCNAPVSWTAPTATDDCGVASLTSNFNIGHTFSEGVTTIIYTAVDNCNNSSTASFNVTIVCACNTAPQLTCPADFVGCVGSSSDPATTGAAVALPGSTTCGTPALNYNDVVISSGPCSGAVFLERTWTATVSNNNSLTTSCVQSVTLGDNASPTLTNIPADITVHGSGANCSVPVKWAAPTVNDDCGATISSNHSSGSSFSEGTTSVVFIVTDDCGNSVTGGFNVTVECAAGCVNPPVITCPANFSECVGGFIPSPSVAGLATAAPASTICNAPYLYYSDFIVAFGSCSGAYTVERTWTALDFGSGLTSSCVQVIELGDGGNPVISGTPQNIILAGTGANCEAVATWTEPTATDDCSVSNFSSDYSSGTTFGQGTTTITYTASDFCGNVTTSSFTVTVQCAAPLCTTPPNISCPANFVSCPGSGVPVPSVIGQATATPGSSECGTPLISYTDQLVTNSNCPNGGTYNRTWVASDPNDPSLSTTCIQTITLQDNDQPIVTNVPGNISLEGTGTGCEAVATWTEPNASDNCGLASFTSNYASGTSFAQGSTTVTYTAVDNCGNTTVGSFTVSVNCTSATCNTPPAITCPPDYTACADGTVPGLNVTGFAFGIINGPNCSGTPYTTYNDVIISSGPCAGAQVIERTWTSTDPSNKLQSSCVQMISLVDNNPPVISNLPGNIIVTGSGFGCQVPVSWTAPTATDDCGVASLTSNIGSGITFTQGTTTITYTAVDNCGNETAASFTVTVQCEGCTVPPSITCPAAYTTCVNTSIDPSVAGSAVGAITGTNCTGAPYVSHMDVTISNGPCSGETVIERNWMATNPQNMLFSTCTQIITVEDNGGPTISNMPNNIAVTGTGTGCQVPLTWNAPTATDDCGIASFTSNYTSGSSFPEGTTTITYTAVDHCGQSVTASFTVTVTCEICSTPPILTCPANVYECAGGDTSPSFTGVATASNAAGCTGTPYVTYSDVTTSTGPCAGAVTIERTWIAYDPNTNLSTSCIQIISLGDATYPTLSNVPTNIVVSGTGNGCQVPVTWTAPTAFDNCGTVNITSTHISGNYFSEGTTTVTYSATDGCGNSVSSTFTVTVQCAGCNTPPAITCPTNYSACPGGGASPSLTGYATAFNNGAHCTTTPNVTYSDATISSGPCAGAMVVERTWIASDPITGLTTSCIQSISLNDATQPVLSNLPANITVSGSGTGCQVQATWAAPYVTDNCGTVGLSSSHASGAYFSEGVTTVTYTATDGCGNNVSYSFTVTVVCAGCNTPPGITCPTNYSACAAGGTSPSICGYATAYNNGAHCTATPNVTYSDATISSGPCAGAMVIERTWIASDPSTGLTSSCVQTISLGDNSNPVIHNLPNNITVTGTGINCLAPVTWTEPTASDNCGAPTLTSNYASGTIFSQGSTTVTYTAVDACGNTATGTFVITVQCAGCNTTPGITCPANYTACPGTSTSSSVCGAAIGYNNGANCYTTPTVTYSDNIVSTGPCYGAKVINRTWMAYDPSTGLSSSCVQTIALEDNTPPVITNMPADQTVYGTGSGCSVLVTWLEPTVTDNCSILSSGCQYVNGGYFNAGNYTVTYTAEDNCGNVTTASFTVTVICESCTTPPVISCPPAYAACPNGDISPSTCGVATAYNTGANCAGNPTITYNDVTVSTGPCAGEKVIERTWTATDPGSGLTATCVQVITLADNQAPVFSNTPGNITITGTGTGCTEVVTWTAPNVADNCGIDTYICNYASGDVFAEGTTTVICTATDYCGNQSTTSFDVIITCETCSSTPIITCPDNYTACPDGTLPLPAVTGVATAVPGEALCGTPVITYADMVTSGPCTGQQMISRTWTATDALDPALFTTCVQTINLADTTPPVITGCSPGIILMGSTGSTGSGTGSGTPGGPSGVCSAIATWTPPVATDDCSSVTVIGYDDMGNVINSGHTFVEGTNTVTYIATDACGNSSSCSFDVIVSCSTICDVDPIAVCPADITVCVNGDITPAATGQGGYIAYPLCTDINVTHSDSLISTGACTGEAVIERTWNVLIQENAGYEDSCVQTITIEDTAPSLVSCPADMTVNGETTPVTWSAPTVTDACGNAVLTSSHSSGSTFPCGVTTVTYTLTDNCGNVETCDFTVTVNCTAGSSGFTNCPSNMTLPCTGTGAVANWTPPTYNSSCTSCLTGSPIPGFIYMGNYGGSHFYCSINPATWPTAKNICESNGGFLADVNGPEENAFLADQLSIASAWIGLTDVNGEGNFEWCNGDSLTYTNWYPGQPNNYGGNQDYCEMLSNGQWNDQYNNYALEYIMEIPCTTITQTAGPAPGSHLTPGTYTVTYTVNDPCGSTETCNFNITVEDCSTTLCESGGLISECAYINQCDFGTISNLSGDNGGYADYTNLCTTIEPGMYVPIEFHPGHCAKPHVIYWTCWIDFNQDGDFYDNYEFVAYGAGATSINGGITIPAGIPNGTCTMRVSAKLGGYATDPCGTFLYGETEDYCVTVINGTLLTDNGEGTVSSRSKDNTSAVELTAIKTVEVEDSSDTSTSEEVIVIDEIEMEEVAVEETVVLEELEIKIYPNPVSNTMNIDLEDISTIKEMKLFDQNGRIARTLEVVDRSSVDVSDLNAGMYIVRIMRTDGTMQSRKVIIMH